MVRHLVVGLCVEILAGVLAVGDTPLAFDHACIKGAAARRLFISRDVLCMTAALASGVSDRAICTSSDIQLMLRKLALLIQFPLTLRATGHNAGTGFDSCGRAFTYASTDKRTALPCCLTWFSTDG